jgi:rubrerythrin
MVIDNYKGDFNTEDFINQMTLSIETEQDAFNVAMKLEAQALNFYMCNSDICCNKRQKEILIQFAEEEKVYLIHLDSLVKT